MAIYQRFSHRFAGFPPTNHLDPVGLRSDLLSIRPSELWHPTILSVSISSDTDTIAYQWIIYIYSDPLIDNIIICHLIYTYYILLYYFYTHRPRDLPKPRIAQIPGNSVRRQTTEGVARVLTGTCCFYTYHTTRTCCFCISYGINHTLIRVSYRVWRRDQNPPPPWNN